MTTISDHAHTADPVSSAAPRGYASHKDDRLSRLHKAEGQVRGITRMVGEDRYCIDILTHISAVTRALQEVALGLLDDHVRHCVHSAVRTDEAEGDAKLGELTLALRRTPRL
ncbi:metal-sensitive transcriptional regulator [Streptomyces bobili]|uniref:metal-sensitive transcriptional regulator n=1 Tax=Streptomyces bobili TaxID=67280 RepID=UPI0034128707